MRTIPLVELLPKQFFDRLMLLDARFSEKITSWEFSKKTTADDDVLASHMYEFIADLILHTKSQSGELRHELIEFVHQFDKRFFYDVYEKYDHKHLVEQVKTTEVLYYHKLEDDHLDHIEQQLRMNAKELSNRQE